MLMFAPTRKWYFYLLIYWGTHHLPSLIGKVATVGCRKGFQFYEIIMDEQCSPLQVELGGYPLVLLLHIMNGLFVGAISNRPFRW